MLTFPGRRTGRREVGGIPERRVAHDLQVLADGEALGVGAAGADDPGSAVVAREPEPYGIELDRARVEAVRSPLLGTQAEDRVLALDHLGRHEAERRARVGHLQARISGIQGARVVAVVDEVVRHQGIGADLRRRHDGHLPLDRHLGRRLRALLVHTGPWQWRQCWSKRRRPYPAFVRSIEGRICSCEGGDRSRRRVVSRQCSSRISTDESYISSRGSALPSAPRPAPHRPADRHRGRMRSLWATGSRGQTRRGERPSWGALVGWPPRPHA